MSVSPDATVSLKQLDGSTRHVNHVKRPVAEDTLRPLDLILTEDGRCNYISPKGEACGRVRVKEDRYQARHWLTHHAMKELSQIECHKLDMSEATIINTEAKVNAAKKYKTRCPLSCPHKRTRTADSFVRHYCLVRHMVRCAKRQNIELSKINANKWARENMEVCRPSREFGSGYLAAVWRIHHAS